LAGPARTANSGLLVKLRTVGIDCCTYVVVEVITLLASTAKAATVSRAGGIYPQRRIDAIAVLQKVALLAGITYVLSIVEVYA